RIRTIEMKPVLLLLVLALLLPTIAHAQDSQFITETFQQDDLEREYTLYLPDDYDPEEPLPMVVTLHGRFQTGAEMGSYMDLHNFANANDFIVLYPQALDGEWNFLHGIEGTTTGEHSDVDFINSVVDEVTEDYNVDVTRRYVMGMSNGGLMVQRIACETPERYAAFASVASSAFNGMQFVCMEGGQQTAPMLLMHGTDDTNIPWDGLTSTASGQTVQLTLPVPEALGFWAAFNGCNPSSDSSMFPSLGLSPGTEVRMLVVDCPENTGVSLYAIVGGGHNYPGHDGLPVQLAGLVNKDIDANREIWAFFQRFTRVAGV
ncbi:MAG: PHB depolymerase family esterase, partial [Chloroflexota bacterium]